jgi:hypothetical protein
MINEAATINKNETNIEEEDLNVIKKLGLEKWKQDFDIINEFHFSKNSSTFFLTHILLSTFIDIILHHNFISGTSYPLDILSRYIQYSKVLSDFLTDINSEGI